MTARAATATTTARRLIIKVDTLNSTVLPTDVAPDPGESERPPPPPLWRWLWVLPGLLVIAGLFASFTVYLPYYAYTPGSATDTEHVIKIEGAQSYPSKGEIDYTTVRIKHLTLLRAFQAWRDPAIDVVSEKAYLGQPVAVREQGVQPAAHGRLEAGRGLRRARRGSGTRCPSPAAAQSCARCRRMCPRRRC